MYLPLLLICDEIGPGNHSKSTYTLEPRDGANPNAYKNVRAKGEAGL